MKCLKSLFEIAFILDYLCKGRKIILALHFYNIFSSWSSNKLLAHLLQLTVSSRIILFWKPTLNTLIPSPYSWEPALSSEVYKYTYLLYPESQFPGQNPILFNLMTHDNLCFFPAECLKYLQTIYNPYSTFFFFFLLSRSICFIYLSNAS